MILAARFIYDGQVRHVDNVTLEGYPIPSHLIGFEMRKSGRFSYKIKRYSWDKMTNIRFIQSMERRGAIIGRP